MQQNRRGARDSAERDGFLEAFELIGSGKIALGAWLFQFVLICRFARCFSSRCEGVAFPGADVAVVPPWAQEGFGREVCVSLRHESLQPRPGHVHDAVSTQA